MTYHAVVRNTRDDLTGFGAIPAETRRARRLPRSTSGVMMKVKDIMTSEPLSCSPEASAADAAGQMWEGDCGILPVAEEGS